MVLEFSISLFRVYPILLFKSHDLVNMQYITMKFLLYRNLLVKSRGNYIHSYLLLSVKFTRGDCKCSLGIFGFLVISFERRYSRLPQKKNYAFRNAVHPLFEEKTSINSSSTFWYEDYSLKWSNSECYAAYLSRPPIVWR